MAMAAMAVTSAWCCAACSARRGGEQMEGARWLWRLRPRAEEPEVEGKSSWIICNRDQWNSRARSHARCEYMPLLCQCAAVLKCLACAGACSLCW